MDKPNAIIRSITFEITPRNANGEVTLIVVARVGDGDDAVNMGNEYTCVPEMLSHVQQLAANQVMDLAFDYLAHDARCIVCETCGTRTTKAWSTEVEPEWHCDTCDSVQPQTTQPRAVTIYKSIGNPRLMRPFLTCDEAQKEEIVGRGPYEVLPNPSEMSGMTQTCRHPDDKWAREVIGLGFPLTLKP